MRFSDEVTWGGDIPPIEGDFVVVPEGKTLLMDITPPELHTIIVEGTLIFEDVKDLELSVGFLIVNNGRFIAGTE